jgi:pyruvate dehydrogenase E2 component (dihydrolipoamide acetyltransferase)
MASRRAPHNSVRRRLAVATWRAPTDARIYTRLELDATALLAYVQATRQRSGERVTITHVVGAALGRAIRAVPDVRSRVVFGRISTTEACDVGFVVDISDGGDLAPVKVRGVDRKSPADIARELSPGVTRVRAGTDPNHSRSSSIIRHVPWWTLRPLLNVVSLLVGGLGVSAFGQPGFPFGSALISNVGPLGLDEAYMAPVPFARVPLYLAVGSVHDAAVAVHGQVVVRPRMVLIGTADHRLIDGAHAGQVARVLRELLAEPTRLDEPDGPAPG